MIDVFNINDLVYTVNAHAEQKEDGTGGNSYKEVLDSIRRIVSQNHSSELVGILYSREAGDRLKNLIVRYINQNRFSVMQIGNIAELADRIYEDMAGFGILTKYLSDPNVEEININAWNSIEVVYPDGVKRPEETFLSPEDCMDKIKKMIWLGGSIIDGSNPTVDSFIGEGVRISAIIPPCVDKKTGGVASIRRQKKNVITKELMLQYQSATEEELSFLSLCVNHGVSLAIAGSTGSGKTTDLGYLIGCLGKDKRIYTIEDTRELNITRLDEKGHMLNRVVQTVTKDEGGRVTMDDLLKKALRFHPDVIIPAEMRGQEAMTAIEAGRTGHTIITTLHSNSALDVVYATLHAKSVTDTIDRMVDVFPPKQQEQIRLQLSGVLRGILHQRLLRGSGGMVPLVELLAVDDVIAAMIAGKQKANSIRDHLRSKAAFGNVHVADNAAWHIQNGRISLEAVMPYLSRDDCAMTQAIVGTETTRRGLHGKPSF